MRLLLVLLLAGCIPRPVPPVPPAPDVDAAPVERSCAAACQHLRVLGCEAGAPTPRGASCEAVCLNIQESGIVGRDLACVVGASTCAAADRCR